MVTMNKKPLSFILRSNSNGTNSLYERNRARLEGISRQKESFLGDGEYLASAGWHLDNYCQALPSEQVGLPQENGSFRAACQVLKNYSFAPPALITGVFDPEQELGKRVMALRGRFLFFTFWFGVKVSRVINEIRSLPQGDREVVWGYSYRTLERHFEEGEITFTIHKIISTGRVFLKIEAISKTGHIANPFYRIGFKLVGRYLQIYFAREAMRRTLLQTCEILRTGQPVYDWHAPDSLSSEDVPTDINIS